MHPRCRGARRISRSSDTGSEPLKLRSWSSLCRSLDEIIPLDITHKAYAVASGAISILSVAGRRRAPMARSSPNVGSAGARGISLSRIILAVIFSIHRVYPPVTKNCDLRLITVISRRRCRHAERAGRIMFDQSGGHVGAPGAVSDRKRVLLIHNPTSGCRNARRRLRRMIGSSVAEGLSLDVFVARADPARAKASRRKWCRETNRSRQWQTADAGRWPAPQRAQPHAAAQSPGGGTPRTDSRRYRVNPWSAVLLRQTPSRTVAQAPIAVRPITACGRSRDVRKGMASISFVGVALLREEVRPDVIVCPGQRQANCDMVLAAVDARRGLVHPARLGLASTPPPTESEAMPSGMPRGL